MCSNIEVVYALSPFFPPRSCARITIAVMCIVLKVEHPVRSTLYTLPEVTHRRRNDARRHHAPTVDATVFSTELMLSCTRPSPTCRAACTTRTRFVFAFLTERERGGVRIKPTLETERECESERGERQGLPCPCGTDTGRMRYPMICTLKRQRC